MCALSICLVSSYQHLLLSCITHRLLALSIPHSPVLHSVRVWQYCSAGEARELLVPHLGSGVRVGELAPGRSSCPGCSLSGTWRRLPERDHFPALFSSQLACGMEGHVRPGELHDLHVCSGY